MTPDQVRRKFRENAVLVLEAARTERILESVGRIEDISDVGTIIADCVAA
jgi:nitrate reductase NapAB chaperone NapD